MKLQRRFFVNVDGVRTLTDLLSYSAAITDSGDNVIEEPTPAKISDGLYEVTLDDTLYTAEASYRLTGTYVMVAGHTQVFFLDFTFPAAGGGGGTIVNITLPVAAVLDTNNISVAVEVER